jgi:saccharopine dehydrogenase-like NADP-dependent oxidoreductase
MKIAVLGAGLIGRAMAADLAKDASLDVLVTDIRQEALDAFARPSRVRTKLADLWSPTELGTIVTESDIVLSAVPASMGYRTLETILELGKNAVDVSFFSEDPFALDPLANRTGATAIVDMGVAPGMSNLLAAYAHAQLDETDSIVIYVGRLPRVRRWPFEYKAGLSPIDVVEEHGRPARYVENGKLVTRATLTDAEYIHFPDVGTLEASTTDGLRTMLKTTKVPNLKEKTLRYPGHIERMSMFRDAGFFGTHPIEVGGVTIRPVDLTATLLFPQWKLEPGEVDITVLRVVVEGTKSGKATRVTFDLFDTLDPSTGLHSAARTVGFAATAAVRMIARGLFADKGIFAPELIGLRSPCVEFLLAELRSRGVIYKETIEFP